MTEEDLRNQLDVARKAVGGWKRISSDERDELLGESIAAYWTYSSDLTKPVIHNVVAWLLKTARLIRLARQRKEASQAVVSLEWPDAVVDRHAGSAEGVLSYRSGRTIRFDDSIGWRRLPTKHRLLLVRVIAEDASVADAAKELGMKRSTAKSWIDRDMKRLETDTTLRRFAGITSTALRGDRP